MSLGANFSTICPNCKLALENTQIPYGAVFSCHQCHGQAISLAVVQQLSSRRLINEVWTRSQYESRVTSKPCARCKKKMGHVNTGPKLGSLELCVCQDCSMIWFDRGLLQKWIASSRLVAPVQPDVSVSTEQMLLKGTPEVEGVGDVLEVLAALLGWY